MKYIDPEAVGFEAAEISLSLEKPNVKNLLCPRDGHYCEQPNCENCMFELVCEG